MTNHMTFLAAATCIIFVLLQVSNAQNTDSDLLELVNSLRSNLGAQRLCFSNALNNAAKTHSEDMARSGAMEHAGTDGSSPFDRMRRAGYTGSSMAENIAFGLDNIRTIFQMWRNSPGHFKNMVNPNFNKIGIARATSACPNSGGQCTYWTQNFGRGNSNACDTSTTAPSVERIVSAVRNIRTLPEISREIRQSPSPLPVTQQTPPQPRTAVSNTTPQGKTPPRRCRIRRRTARL